MKAPSESDVTRRDRAGDGDVAWRAFFDDSYFHLHQPFFGEAESRLEVAGAIELLGLPLGAHVLDAPCGWGRHTFLLAEAGMRPFGADLSWALLRGAQGGADGGGARPLVAADLRRLPFPDAAFNAVLNIGSNLGVFADNAEALAALRESRRVLAPGGGLLLESMHRDDVVSSYASRDRWTLPDGTEVRVRRRFDPVTGISRERMRWRRGDSAGEKRHALRLRTATEVVGLLGDADFREIVCHGEWEGGHLELSSPRLIVVARR